MKPCCNRPHIYHVRIYPAEISGFGLENDTAGSCGSSSSCHCRPPLSGETARLFSGEDCRENGEIPDPAAPIRHLQGGAGGRRSLTKMPGLLESESFLIQVLSASAPRRAADRKDAAAPETAKGEVVFRKRSGRARPVPEWAAAWHTWNFPHWNFQKGGARCGRLRSWST